ncbi:MAG: helix-turn-helix domain-containing protein [Candidatus Marinimicrobia bacterium]|nr:helix-turn-helix domain-containing protein [Candidatus Neomarinimicrobiota bacterium]
MEIGNHLKQVRKAHQLLQKDLADRAGLDRSYISKLERGLGDPTWSTLTKIADAYGLSVPHLLNYGNEENFSLDVDAAIDALKTLKYNMVKVELNIKPL